MKHKTISPQFWASSLLPTARMVHLHLVQPRSSPWPPPGGYITSPGDLPAQGSNPGLLHWQADSFTTWESQTFT